MTESQKKAHKAFEIFLDELCDHIKIVGGVGDPNRYRRMPLEEVFTELHPNNITIGFANDRMIPPHRLSRNLR